ncbi:Glycine betaine/L-proline transport system permease protein proW [Oligella ureolytica]|uniref:Glycine betaine/L-proline transport system permease protein proW n=1 Tax=Oligella ureolytica TaxID=90244 RepID=A0A378XFB3_9BURK|nr:proline/glycine betaine ABC transporter permease [Oligella ureolytica]QPT39030.1 proline/glycine betaine ABC transporter permease [Oligella ureolytica]SUA54549.1 Glycine betaine/L-proline transport system permease protein proW [Oligella ureolytica]
MFPEIFSARDARRSIDGFVDGLVVKYADALTAMSQPFLKTLVWIEMVLRSAPWWSIVIAVILLAYLASRRVGFAIGMGFLMFLLGAIGLWEQGMQTLSLMIMATALSVLIGIPLGIITGKSKAVRSVMLPTLDVMQTMPSFVYLIPVVMLFGLGKIPAIIATVIYAVPPLIRLTDLGIRLVDKEVLEASRSFGSNSWQQLFGVQLPLALPNIMAGLNQTTMMALSMVVIASMIGARGLGYEVLLGINRLEVGRGLLAGIGIVILAVIFDRITQAYGKRIQARKA